MERLGVRLRFHDEVEGIAILLYAFRCCHRSTLFSAGAVSQLCLEALLGEAISGFVWPEALKGYIQMECSRIQNTFRKVFILFIN